MLHYFDEVTNSILVLATSFILLVLRSLCFAYRSVVNIFQKVPNEKCLNLEVKFLNIETFLGTVKLSYLYLFGGG